MVLVSPPSIYEASAPRKNHGQADPQGKSSAARTISDPCASPQAGGCPCPRCARGPTPVQERTTNRKLGLERFVVCCRCVPEQLPASQVGAGAIWSLPENSASQSLPLRRCAVSPSHLTSSSSTLTDGSATPWTISLRPMACPSRAAQLRVCSNVHIERCLQASLQCAGRCLALGMRPGAMEWACERAAAGPKIWGRNPRVARAEVGLRPR